MKLCVKRPERQQVNRVGVNLDRMESEKIKAIKLRQKRALRVRRKLIQSPRPRLSVFRSAKHVYAQIIDDNQSLTICGFGTYDKSLKSMKDKKQAAKAVGLKLAQKAKEHNIEEVVFDRGRYKFHGRIAAIAEGAREGGLSF